MHKQIDDKIEVNINLKYNDDISFGDDYEGHIRAYITEVVSRYDNSDDEPIPFAFLDYAFDEDVTLTPHELYEDSMIWDASDAGFDNTDYNNLAVVFTLFNRGEPYQTDEYTIQTSGTLPPILNINNPSNEDEVSDQVNIEAMAVGNFSEIEKVEYQIDDGEFSDLSSKGSDIFGSEWNSREVGNGNYIITIKATDEKGTSNYEQIEVIVENDELPENHKTTIVITDPTEGSIVEGMVTIEGNAEDEDGNEEIEKVEIKVEDESWGIADGTTDWSYEIDTSNYDDSSYRIYTRAYDGIDYSKLSYIDLYFDNEEEPGNNKPIVEITEPEDGSTVNGNVLITGNSFDEDGNEEIERVEVKVENEGWGVSEGIVDWSYEIDTTDFQDGDYTIYARAFDGKDYSDEVYINLIFDNEEEQGNNRPLVGISDPEDGRIVSGTITIEGLADDQDGNEEIEKVEVKVEGDENWKIVDGTTNWNYDLDTTEYEDENYNIYARAYDGKDYSEVTYIKLEFDNEIEDYELPVVTNIIQTPNKPTATNDVKISAIVTDNIEVNSVKLSYEACKENVCLESETKEMNKNGDEYSITIGPFDDGMEVKYFISVKDSYGNEKKTEEMSFGIKDENPPEITEIYFLPENPTTADEITVYVTVKDESILESVQITYEGQTESMSEYANNQFRAIIGPFQRGKISFEIFTEDNKGNENETSKNKIFIVENLPEIISIEYGPENPTSEDDVIVNILLSGEVDDVELFYSKVGTSFIQKVMNYEGENKYTVNIGKFDAGKVTFYMIIYQNGEIENSEIETIEIMEIENTDDDSIPGFNFMFAIVAIGIILVIRRKK